MSLIPLVRRAGLEELHDWLETARLVMSAARRRLQTLHVLRCTKTACSPLSAVVRLCPRPKRTLCAMSAVVRGSLGFVACGGGNLVRGCPRTTKRCVSVRKHLSAMSAALKYMIFCLSAASHELLLICGSFASGCPVSGYVFWWYL